MTITEFLLARIAEGEREASVYAKFSGSLKPSSRKTPDAGVRMPDPRRLLAECEAKRAIISSLVAFEAVRDGASAAREPFLNMTSSGATRGLEEAIRCLVTVYKDHPDYQEEWK